MRRLRSDIFGSLQSVPASTGRGYEVEFEPTQRIRGAKPLVVVYLVVAFAYLCWRVSIINWDVWYGPVTSVIDFYTVLATGLFLWLTMAIHLPVHRPITQHRVVDVLIPTYNEPLPILRATIRAARGIRGIRRVLVLDDGNNPEVQALSRRLRVRYHPRTTDEHAKAGNLNNGLQFTDAELFICLDADHIPVPEFLERTQGYFDDPTLAFVQSPQLFYNQSSFLFRHTRRGLYAEQGTFYRVMQPAKNRHNAAFFVGTSAVMRRAALDSVGGFAIGTATEDIHTSLRLHAKGWKSIFVSEELAHGLEAENLKEFYKQRRRWAAGSLGLLLRSPDSPLRVRGLTVPQRLNYLSATVAHFLGVQKLFYFALPVLCILGLTSPFRVGPTIALSALTSFAVLSVTLTYVFGRGTYRPLLSEAYNMANLAAHVAGLWGIIRVQKKFSVSRKLVGRKEHTRLKAVWWTLLAVAFATAARAVDLLARDRHLGKSSEHLLIGSLIFLAYNTVVLLTFFGHLLRYEARNADAARAEVLADLQGTTRNATAGAVG